MSSDSRYSYDEKSEVWPYFALTVVGVIVVPATIVSVFNGVKKEPLRGGAAPADMAKPENEAEIKKFQSRQKRQSLLSLNNVLLLAGWGFIAFLVQLVMNQQTQPSGITFDPYEILGVTISSTEKDIRSMYRKLSVKFHPDKIRDVGNSTREILESQFVEITKAYKALTDVEVRENYLKYGHPDGPQQQSHGIALPKFLVEGKGSPFVIFGYAVLVGGILPWVVGSWWSRARVYTKTGVHQETAALIFERCAKEQPHFVNYDKILTMLSEAVEYKLLLPKKKPADIRHLIDSHLKREIVANEQDKLLVVSKSIKLLEGMLDIASSFKDAGLCQRIIDVQRCIIQAVPVESASGELLQLPGVQLSDIQKLNSNDTSELAAPIQEYQKKVIPVMHLVASYFKVPGESVIPPMSQAHLVIKYAILPYGVRLPPIDEKKLKEQERLDDDDIKILKDPLSTNENAPIVPSVCAPYFPDSSYKPVWYGFIISERDNKVVEGPAKMSRVDFSNLNLSAADLADGSKLTIGTYKIQLTTPTPQMIGQFQFKVGLYSSGYFGCDLVESVNMKVENPPAIQIADDEYDISDPEEDSIAGAVSQLKGETIRKSSTKKDGGLNNGNNNNDDDDDDDEEEDLSDINTDTEDEADSYTEK